MTDYTKMYAEKLTTADELAARVESGWSIGMDTSVSAAPAAPSVYEQRRADLRLVRREPAPPAPSGRTRSGESLRSRSAGASSRSGSGRIDASARSRSARPSNRSNYRR